jgi:Family of unknown function (DUF5716)
MSDVSLSRKLLENVSQEFFRPLSRPSSAIYVDCAERLAEEAGEAGRLPHVDAIAIIREVVSSHPDIALAEDEGANMRDARQRAGQLFNRLCDAKWMEDQQLGLHERYALISPGLRPLLRMLRDLAEDEIAELKTFADTLKGVCNTLEQEDLFAATRDGDGQIRSILSDVNARLDHAIVQLHGVEKLISIFDRKQRLSDTPAETLRMLYAEFGVGQHMICYDALRRGGLLPRIQALRLVIADHRDNPLIKEQLAKDLEIHYGYDSIEAYHRSEKMLRTTEHKLGSIRLIAESIDARMASFNHLSLQRYRYQTELRGRRPEIVKKYCDHINQHHEQQKISQLRDQEPDFSPLISEVKCYYGTDSLARTRKVKTAADLSFDHDRLHTEENLADTMAGLRDRQRLALTPQRAARLLLKLLPAQQGVFETDSFSASDDEEMLDLLAIAAFETAISADGKNIRWQVDSENREHGLNPAAIQRDRHANWLVDRFTITRKK